MTAEPSIPAQSRPAYDAIVSLIDRFCQANLTPEYQKMCRELAAVLARKRPSPLLRGKPEVWACAVIRVIGWVNFLDGRSEKPHMKEADGHRQSFRRCRKHRPGQGEGDPENAQDSQLRRRLDVAQSVAQAPQTLDDSDVCWASGRSPEHRRKRRRGSSL